ncbi:hypothetical protein OEA41_003468 [Lepraria neglecta]|uniref:Probable glucan endo-1,3-beta-glucosidase eglC n=1 Tax=Lepraria neglecta TaxID=209136 RepID=A0AAE0DIX6_9LECA|nr:hypothetical protein OEA41_003468 [Lepraria neglecta]
MLSSTLITLAASLSVASAQVYKGFNYGATNTDNSPITESQYQNDFSTAQKLVGASGFTSGRLYTSIQAGTIDTYTEAFQAAINTKTSLLLGLWGSGGQAGLSNEITALQAAIKNFGSSLTDLIVGISVGSEDLYRISPTGIENMSGIGAGPDVISNYIGQVKSAIAGTAANGKPVGHVDTWTAWINGSNDAVIAAADFIGMDAYPYFQNTMTNPIADGYSLFFDAYDATVSVAGGKPVWVTETGWPISGATENQAVPSLQNAKTYWDQVGCGRLFGQVNTWWYTLQDAFPTTPSPSFGVVGTTLSDTPLYDLSCSGVSTSASDIPSASVTAAIESATAASAQAGNVGTGQKIGSGSEAQGQNAGSASSPAGTSPAAQQQTSATETQAPAQALESTIFSTKGVTITSCPGGCPKESQLQTEAPTVPPATAPTTLITKTSVLPSASAASASSCLASLSGTYEYPHLIVPVDKTQPDKAGGTSYNGTISSTISSIFNFDIPQTDSGKTCTLVFLLPQQDQLTTSVFSLSGSGGFDVAQLSSPVTEQTSYNTVSSVSSDLGGPESVTPGNEYVIASGSCAASQRISYEVTATGSLDLNYFQDFNPSPIGFYVTVC